MNDDVDHVALAPSPPGEVGGAQREARSSLLDERLELQLLQWGVAIEIERAIKKSARFC